jgi:tetratricopeptide (TPR) repeat protein
MRRAVALLVLLLTGSALFAGEPDRVKLRQAAHLPSIEAMTGIQWDSDRGFYLAGAPADPRPEIDRIRKAMTGDARDADRYRRLAELYTQLKDGPQSLQPGARAVELYRQTAKAEPNNGAVLARLGEALDGAGEKEEAEAVLRRAVSVSPDEPATWLALGSFLTGRTASALLPTPGQRCNGAEALALAMSGRVSRQAGERAGKYLEEAHVCYDRAVACGPRSAQTYADRAMYRSFESNWANAIRFVRGEPLHEHDPKFTEQAVADMKRAAELAPDDPRLVGSAALWETGALAERLGKCSMVMAALSDLWDSFPAATKQAMRDAADRLEKLGRSADVRTAADALELRGCLQGLIMNDLAGADATWRRALALDPGRESVWDILIALNVTALQRPDKALDLARQRLTHRDSAANRFIAAKVCERLERWDEAEEHLRAGLKLGANDVPATLGLAALCLRRDDDRSRAEAGQLLARAQGLLTDDSPPSQRLDHAAARAVYLALTGHADEAVPLLKAVLQKNGHHRTAGEALEALAR